MNHRKKQILGWGILGFLIGGTLLFWFGDILSSPGDYYFHKYGDGLKNYYTPWYHVKYDSSFTWFEGMNYPYGDHVVFADGQPLVTNTLKVINEVVDTSDHTIGILNVLMLLSPLLTGIFIFLILRRFGVTAWFAAFAAASIALMSPQLIRTSAHYALAYSFFIPMFWYLAIRAWENLKLSISLILFLALYISAWVHPYYLMIGAVFLVFGWGVKWIWFGFRKKWWVELGHFLIQAALPVILFKLVLGWTDPITDRPSSPYGFEEFYATWRTLFLPYPIPGMSWTHQFMTPREVSWEGVAYVGLLGAGTLFFFIGRVIRRIFRKRNHRWVRRIRLGLQPSTNEIVAISALAGLAIGIFACGFPFAIKPERMTELFPPIKQFRSLGRFAWAFYYAWTVFGFYTIYLLWKRFSQKGKQFWGYLCLVPGLLFFVEAFSYQYPVKDKISNKAIPELQSEGAKSPIGGALAGIDTEAYDALLVLPYFHIGSENLFAYDSLSVQAAFPAAMQTGLPLMNVMMSRGSLDQAWKQLQFVSARNYRAEITSDLPKDCKVLVIQREPTRNGSGIRKGLTKETGSSAFMGEGLNLKLLRSNAEDGIRIYEWTNAPKAGHPPHPMDKALDSLPEISDSASTGKPIFSESWESGTVPGFVGQGRELKRFENNFIYDEIPEVNSGDTLVASLWVKMRQDQLPLTYFGFEEKSPSDELLVWDYTSFTDFTLQFYGEWALCEREFVVKERGNRIRINITKWKKKPPVIVVDEFQLRKKGEKVKTDVQGVAMEKNRPLDFSLVAKNQPE